jgi:hypothetical protein
MSLALPSPGHQPAIPVGEGRQVGSTVGAGVGVGDAVGAGVGVGVGVDDATSPSKAPMSQAGP